MGQQMGQLRPGEVRSRVRYRQVAEVGRSQAWGCGFGSLSVQCVLRGGLFSALGTLKGGWPNEAL